MGTSRHNAKDELRSAWNELIANLERARDAIDEPALMPVPESDRNLADGFVQRSLQDATQDPPGPGRGRHYCSY